MHNPNASVDTLQRWSRWLGVFFTLLASGMAATVGYRFGGVDPLASWLLAGLLGGLTIVVALMLPFIDMAWSAGEKKIARGMAAAFVLCLFGEFCSHAAFSTGHRADNIDRAQFQNMKGDDIRQSITNTEAALKLGEARLAAMEAEAAWLTTQSADALRAEARAEEMRGGCKTKCETLKARVAQAEAKSRIDAEVSEHRATLARLRKQSAETPKGDSIALNQSGLFATAATGSLTPTVAAMAWANVWIGGYLAMLSTGLGSLCNWLGFHRFARKPDEPEAEPVRPEAPKGPLTPGAMIVAPAGFVPGLSPQGYPTPLVIHTRDGGMGHVWASHDEVSRLLSEHGGALAASPAPS